MLVLPGGRTAASWREHRAAWRDRQARLLPCSARCGLLAAVTGSSARPSWPAWTSAIPRSALHFATALVDDRPAWSRPAAVSRPSSTGRASITRSAPTNWRPPTCAKGGAGSPKIKDESTDGPADRPRPMRRRARSSSPAARGSDAVPGRLASLLSRHRPGAARRRSTSLLARAQMAQGIDDAADAQLLAGSKCWKASEHHSETRTSRSPSSTSPRRSSTSIVRFRSRNATIRNAHSLSSSVVMRGSSWMRYGTDPRPHRPAHGKERPPPPRPRGIAGNCPRASPSSTTSRSTNASSHGC